MLLRGLATLSIVLALLGVLHAPVEAQDEESELILSMRRDFGFRAGDRIQGSFTLEAFGPDDLESVEFLLDGEPIGEAHAPPFRFSFSTSQFSLGSHTLMATGSTSGGDLLRSPEHSFEFVSADESWKSAAGIAVPLLITVAVFAILGAVVPGIIGGWRRVFRLGTYGPSGGAICPRCALPYSRHFFALQVLGRKLERCPHCGKWALVPRAATPDLRAAEARVLEGESAAFGNDEAEALRLQRMIEDSKYLD